MFEFNVWHTNSPFVPVGGANLRSKRDYCSYVQMFYCSLQLATKDVSHTEMGNGYDQR